jgi:hypothetical protein
MEGNRVRDPSAITILYKKTAAVDSDQISNASLCNCLHVNQILLPLEGHSQEILWRSANILGLIANRINENLGPPYAVSRIEIFRFRLSNISWRIGICFKISERSKSTSTIFLISGFYSTFGGRIS